MNIRLYKAITPTIAESKQYDVKFYNAIYHPYDNNASPVLSSTGFTLAGSTETHFLDDNGSGVVRTYRMVADTRTYVNTNAGTIADETGAVVIKNLNVTSTVNWNVTIHIFTIVLDGVRIIYHCLTKFNQNPMVFSMNAVKSACISLDKFFKKKKKIKYFKQNIKKQIKLGYYSDLKSKDVKNYPKSTKKFKRKNSDYINKVII